MRPGQADPLIRSVFWGDAMTFGRTSDITLNYSWIYDSLLLSYFPVICIKFVSDITQYQAIKNATGAKCLSLKGNDRNAVLPITRALSYASAPYAFADNGGST